MKAKFSTIAGIYSNDVAKFVRYSIEIAKKIYNTVLKVAKEYGVVSDRVKVERDIDSIKKVIEASSHQLKEYWVVPRSIKDVGMFISSIIDYDGSIHGNVLVLNRNVFTLKGIILESLIRAIESTQRIPVIKTYTTRKYIDELPILINTDLLRYVARYSEHLRKQKLLSRIVDKSVCDISKVSLIDLELLDKYIDKVKLLVLRDREYQTARNYKIVIYAKNPINTHDIAIILRKACIST